MVTQIPTPRMLKVVKAHIHNARDLVLRMVKLENVRLNKQKLCVNVKYKKHRDIKINSTLRLKMKHNSYLKDIICEYFLVYRVE